MLLCRLSYRPTVDPPGLEPGTCRLTVEVTLFFTSPYQCGRWGSNPRHLGGSQGCSRYTTSTKRVRTKRRRKRPNRPSREIEVSRAYASPAAELAGVEPAASRASTGRSSA